VPSKADEYRTEAIGCALKARLTRDRKARAKLKGLVRQWLDRAEEAERSDGAQTSSKPAKIPPAGTVAGA
jgi:hypothetical protein